MRALPAVPRAAAALVAALVVATPAGAGAQCSACSITPSAQPGRLTVTTAVAGSAPTVVVDGTTTLRVVTDGTYTNLTARLATSLPPGVTIQVRVTAASPLFSFGNVTLSTAESAVVGNLTASGSPYTLPITYTVSATSAAGVIALRSQSVTFTFR